MTDVGKAIRSALATARHIAAPLTRARGGAAQSQNAAPVPAAPRPSKPNENEDEPLFDYSRLHETPKVPQTDLPRYDPARGVPDRVKDLVKNKKVRHKMLETIQHGLEKGGANWYNTDPLRDEFIKHLGAREGDAAHRQYMEFVAATSPRSEVGANARNASYYYHRHRLGHPMPKVGDANPQPYGHTAQRLHQVNAQRVTTEGWDPLNNPKPASFVENLAGNQKPVTVDTHAFRLPAIHAQDPRFLETAYSAGKDAPKQNIQQLVERGETKIKKVLPAHWQAMPKTNEYGAMEQFYQGLAKELGITPVQAQAAAWVGGGKLTGLASDESKPFLRFLQDRVYKTAHETGVDPKDVLKDFITGKAPLRADGGPVVGGGVEPQSDPATPPVAGSLAPPLQKKPSIAPPVAQPRHFNGAGMYSHAVEQALALPQVRGAPHQMLASMKGVKQEELANANPAQAFAGKSHVTREELAHHFRTAMPRIHESEFSDDNDPGDDEDEPQGTQYGEYTIPGGRNYRELLLHLPPTPVPPQTPELYRALQAQHDTGEAVRQHVLANGIYRTQRHGDQQFVSNDGKNDHEYQRLQEVAANAQRAYHAAQQAHVAKARDQDFKSSHWSTPNVLAHLRMSNRQIPTNEPYFRWRNPVSRYVSKDFPTQEAAEGHAKNYPPSMRAGLKLEHGDSGRFENALHLEELQSDWGQEGREKGFRDGRPWFQHVNIHSGQKGLPFSSKEEADAAFDKYPEYLKNELKLEQHGGGDPNKVPNGPYVTSTNGWVDLGLKRALLEAARAGHDRLVWTPGAEQAKRYGLSNQLSRVEYIPGLDGGLGFLNGHDKNGRLAVSEAGVTPDKLPDYVGRELASRLLSQPVSDSGGARAHVIEGNDLDVGGEGHKYFYDKLIPGRLKDILKKLGHEAQFDQVRVTHKPKNPTSLDTAMGDLLRGNNRDVAQDMRTTLHSLKLPLELRDKIKKGLPAFARGGAALTQSPTGAYAAGGGVRYDTQQDGPFYRVARKNLGRQPGVSGADAPEVRGPGGAPVGGGAGPIGDGGAEPPAARRLAQLQQIANSHAHSFGHGPVADAGNSESSLHKQSAIGRAFQLAATEHPGYKRVVFDAYRRRHPDLVRQSGARNYDELRHAAYSKLGHEVRRQFDRLPLKLSYHHGAGDYADSKSMRQDVLNNGHLAVFRGGDRHDFLHRVDPRTRLNENEMFRAVHDAYGHALHGSTFGPQGEEKAWNAHRQMFSPLAALAMSAETRGQNSFVNYTPVNAQLLADKHEIEAEIARARKFKDRETEQEALERKKKTMAGWKYAPQKAVLLPPEMNDPQYAGGMPDYLKHLIKPEPGTGLSSPITHFSHSPDVKELDPTRYGTGIPGDERARVMKRPGGVKERAYGYLGTPDQIKPEPGLGAHAYQGHVNDMYDLSTDPLRITQLATEANRTSPLGNFNPNVVNTAQAQNDMERMAKEHGYSGVANPKAAYPMAALFDKVPVSPRGPQPYAAGGNVVDRALAATRGWSKS